jgi:hypothetical protein
VCTTRGCTNWHDGIAPCPAALVTDEAIFAAHPRGSGSLRVASS